jgi:hypothetical protein
MQRQAIPPGEKLPGADGDCYSATISKAWIWHDGGAFFGIPASNFFGWMLTAGLFYLAFALYLRANDDAIRQAASCTRSFRTLAVLYYLISGMTHLVPWIMGQGGEATDGSGYVVHDIRESIVLIMILTMGFTALLALFRLWRPAVVVVATTDANPQRNQTVAPHHVQ